MTDSMDEWDGGAIDGRDQYISDAPHWSNGDGETVDATGPDATGEVVTENVPDPGEEAETDDSDESESDDPEIPTWPPNPETLTELRRRLLNGASTESLADDWPSVSNGAVYTAAIGDTFADVGADIPALKTVGDAQGTEWVIDEDGETQSELTADDFECNEPDGSWPPEATRIDDIRQRLVNGESTAEIAEEYSDVGKDAINGIAKGDTHKEHLARSGTETPPVRYIKSEGWTWTEPVDLETETTDNDDSDPESETADSADKWGGCWMGTDHYLRDAPHWNGDGEAVDATDSDPEPKSETEATDAEEGPEPEPDQQESRLVSGDECPVARDPPEPETPTVPTRWIVAGVAFVTGWILSRLVRGGGDE